MLIKIEVLLTTRMLSFVLIYFPRMPHSSGYSPYLQKSQTPIQSNSHFSVYQNINSYQSNKLFPRPRKKLFQYSLFANSSDDFGNKFMVQFLFMKILIQ